MEAEAKLVPVTQKLEFSLWCVIFLAFFETDCILSEGSMSQKGEHSLLLGLGGRSSPQCSSAATARPRIEATNFKGLACLFSLENQ